MVKRVEDYEYVVGCCIDDEHPHGDMDRILFDGEIMPFRSGVSATTGVERKRILRGEDICFLLEWLAQTLSTIERYAYTYTDSGEWHWYPECNKVEALFSRKLESWHHDSSGSERVSLQLASVLAEELVTYGYRWIDEALLCEKAVYGYGGVLVNAHKALVENYNLIKFDRTDIYPLVDGILKLRPVQALFTQHSILAPKAMVFGGALLPPTNLDDILDVTYTQDWPYYPHPYTGGWSWTKLYEGNWYDESPSFRYGWMEEFHYPRGGQKIYAIVAHHARKVSCMVTFFIKGAKGDFATVFEPHELKKDESQADMWVLTTDEVCGGDPIGKIKDIVKKGGVTTENPYEDSKGVTCYRNLIRCYVSAVPYVMSDDHTQIT